MKNRISINFWQRASRGSSDIVFIQARVTLNNKRVEVGSTGVRLDRIDWDAKNQKVLKSCHGYQQFNIILDRYTSSIYAIYNSYEEKKQNLSAKKLKEILLGSGKPKYTLTDLLNFYIKTNPTLTQDTIKGYRRRFSKALAFNPILESDDIDPVFLNRYRKYLENEKGYKESYVYKCLAVIKMIMDYSYGQGLIDTNKINATSIDRKVEYNTIHLSVEELKKLEKYKFSDNRVQYAIDMYLFCSYTGLSYCDFMRFDCDQIEIINNVKYIRGTRQKTGSEYFLPLFKGAERVLKKYNYQLVKLSDSQTNRLIKVGMKEVIDNGEMVFHSSRKTFANYCLNHRMYSKDTTAKMMGQKDTKELDAYASTSARRVIKETDGKGSLGWINRLRGLFKVQG